MLPDSNAIENGFTAAERILFIRIFTEKLDRDIPALLHDIWDTKVFNVQKPPVDRKSTDRLVLGPTVIPVDEYADYLDLPTVNHTINDCLKIIEIVTTLAEGAAKSYAWNVRNAFIKGGRLRPAFDRLYLTDWDGAFKVNIVKNSEASVGGWPGDLIPGWVAYRYLFAAVKATN